MKRPLFVLGIGLAMGLSACAPMPMTVSQANTNLLLPPSRDGGIGIRRGGPERGRLGITRLRNSIIQGILSAYPSSPDRSYTVTNVTFAEPEGAWRQLPFRATLNVIGIAGPGYPLNQGEVTGLYDRMAGRVINLSREGDASGTQPVDPRVI